MRKRSSSPGPTPSLDPAALRASSTGTSRFAARFATAFAADFFRPLGPLTVSSLGVGTYLGDPDDETDRRYAETIGAALARGVNLIDTAINYRGQRSERAVGAAIEQAIAAGIVQRDELVVCTKGGYVPLDGGAPATRDDYRAYLRREFFEPGVLTPDDIVAGGHSLAPTFLRYSLARSRRNLGVRLIDVYYLHNPEQQATVVSEHSLRERLRAAFMVLEDAVGRGEIGCYGCATWSALRVPPGTKGHLSLEDLATIAREIAGDAHHFRAVQLPVSLLMPEALRVPTQMLAGRAVTVLEAATALGLAVVASAPLAQSQLTHDLPPTVREIFPTLATDAQRALAFVRAMPGVTTALVGTRAVEHLEENLRAATS